MEGLHSLIKDAVESGMITRAKVGQNDHRISHLLYADDVVFITEWSLEAIPNISHVLSTFFKMSGLKINIHKSTVYGVGLG